MIAKLAAVFVLLPLALQAQAQAPALRVMSYNIRHDNPNDGPDAWPNRRDDVASFLRREQLDIIGLQEALRRQLDDLAQRLPGYGEVGVGRDDGRTAGEYAAILYRSDRFEVLESGTFWFSDTPAVPGSRTWGNNVTRICTWARLRDRRPGGGTFYVFNVHLDHESQPSRERSVAALLGAIHARRHADPVIVTGDFNAGEDNPAVRAMSPRFRDTYRERHLGERVVGTFNAFRTDSTGDKIDFVFVDSSFTVNDARLDRPRTDDGRQLSDHFPVSADVLRRFTGIEHPDVAFVPQMEAITVSVTRNERRIEDQALRVEVVEPEEIEEKLAMTPGDIAMLLNETGGVRVQTTAPSLGGANVRIHGMRGRYTQLLADGLPLYGEAGALSIVSIPPMDLMQVEIVKGPASAMYGGAALGGLINLVSRRPHERSRELLVNATTLGAGDAAFFGAQPLGGPWGITMQAGAHQQIVADRDADGWADVPGYERVTLRPRLFYQGGTGRTMFATLGAMIESREGGTLSGALAPDGQPFPTEQRTRRFDAGVSFTLPAGALRWSGRLAGMMASHRHRFGGELDDDRHVTGLAEVSLGRPSERLSWLVGAALPLETFRSDSVSSLDYDHTAPAVFAQSDVALSDRLVAQLSARADFHSAYGTQISPRLSVLWRGSERWTLRLSGASGYFAPTPHVEAAEAVGLRRLGFIAPLGAERATVLSLDFGAELGAIETNVTLFASHIHAPVLEVGLFGIPGSTPAFGIVNGARTRSAGADVIARYHRGPVHAALSWTWSFVEEDLCPSGCAMEAPLNPRHTAGAIAAWERGDWRLGGEFYVTGRQQLGSNSYRTVSPSYAIAGLLVQRRFGRALAFLNFENLTDTRLTRTHALVQPFRTYDTGWTTEVWGPLEGRVVNGGLRVGL